MDFHGFDIQLHGIVMYERAQSLVCMDGWMDDGWMDEWIDGCRYVQMYQCMCWCVYVCVWTCNVCRHA